MIDRLQRRRGEEGFTLVELLVVIAILGILAAVVVFAVGGIKDKGQNQACAIDARTLRTAEEAYATQHDGSYASQDSTDGPTDLVPDFLAAPPTYHTVVAVPGTPTTPPSYTITAVAPCR